jgi:hypothetical protein
MTRSSPQQNTPRHALKATVVAASLKATVVAASLKIVALAPSRQHPTLMQ